MPSQSDIRQQVTDQILAALKNGVAPWKKPWKSLTGPHRNVVSARSYTGVNILLCEIASQRFGGFTSSIWGTFRQWKELGGSVKKRPDDIKPGSWGTTIIFSKPVVKKKQDDDGAETEERWNILKTYTVFNLDQVDGPFDHLRATANPNASTFEQFERGEELIAATGADIRTGSQAAYVPSGDYIIMPPKESFDSSADYAETAFHELAHWTEPAHRLNWDRKGEGYAMGELRAEIAPNLGSEFVPRLSEGAIVVGVIRLAGTDLDESIRSNTQMERAVLTEFPDEVEHVWSRIGSAEVATDPMGIELTDIFITLKPRSQWKKAQTQSELTEKLEKVLRDFPGTKLGFSQPIEMRINEMVSGVRADLGVKLFGDDFDVLVEKAQEIETILRSIDGAADVNTEQVTGQPMLQIKIKQDQIARYGVSAQTVLDFVESIGSKPVGEIVEGQLRFPLIVRMPEQVRASPESIGAMLIATPTGERIPLSRLASVEVVEGPSTITREWGQRRITITSNVRGRDLGGFVAEARQKIGEQVSLPSGRYRVEYGGQFENLQRAQNRLLIVVPVALTLIFVLLYMTYHNVIDTLRVFTGIPFAWVGGIFALWLRDMPFSISAGVGFSQSFEYGSPEWATLGDLIRKHAHEQGRPGGEKCNCPSCNGEMTKPVLRHENPASLVPLPKQAVPSRGWGEDFWVRVTERSGSYFRGVVDNLLVEARLHGLKQGDQIVFHEDHILAVHDIHRQELVVGMDVTDLKELAHWVGQMRRR